MTNDLNYTAIKIMMALGEGKRVVVNNKLIDAIAVIDGKLTVFVWKAPMEYTAHPVNNSPIQVITETVVEVLYEPPKSECA